MKVAIDLILLDKYWMAVGHIHIAAGIEHLGLMWPPKEVEEEEAEVDHLKMRNTVTVDFANLNYCSVVVHLY